MPGINFALGSDPKAKLITNNLFAPDDRLQTSFCRGGETLRPCEMAFRSDDETEPVAIMKPTQSAT